MECYTILEETVQCLLCKKKFADVLKLLKKPDNEILISENVWNLINSVCLMVKTNSLLKNETDIIRCKNILLFLVDKGNPKEVLVSLLEQADSFKDNEFFCLLLEPLQIILKKTPGKRGKSLQWVLSTLNAHIETLDTPDDLDLQGDEKLLLDADQAVRDTTYVLKHYLNFIQFFVDEVSFVNLSKKEIHYFDRVYNQQEIMQRYILKLLHYPLLYHDLQMSYYRPISALQVVCKGYMKCLSKICHNVFNLFKYDCLSISVSEFKSAEDDDDDDDSIPLLAFSNLSYLIFVEYMALSFQPLVYSHHFNFMNNLKYTIPLLRQKENLVLFKGLQLAETLLRQLDDFQLKYDCMELDAFIEFPKLLLEVAIFSQIETHRKSAIAMFMKYASKCDYKGQYHLVMQVLSTINHSGAEGVVIGLYKKNLHDALNGGKSSEFFLGMNLTLFLKKVFVLTDGAETDLIEKSDMIITALNLLRYLFLRDKKKNNVTGIWNLTKYISKFFLKPLSIGLDMSRAHYKEAFKKADDCSKIKDSVNTTVSVNNEILPNVPLNFQKDIYKKALTAFDVIESVLIHVEELMSLNAE